MLHDVGLLTQEELSEGLDAYYTFVRTFGMRYLTQEGKTYFNSLRSEYTTRRTEQQAETQKEASR